MNKNLFLLSTAVASVCLAGCSTPQVDQTKFAAFTAENMDLSINPSDNFYLYANGGWMRQNRLPDDKARFGAFDLLAEENREKVKVVIEEAAQQTAEKGSVAQQIGDLYRSGMDSLARQNVGIAPLLPLFEEVERLQSVQGVTPLLAFLHSYQVNPFFYFFSTPDQKNSEQVIAGIYQGGLGLPDRDYYFDESERGKTILTQYQQYLQKLFELAGNSTQAAAEKSAKLIAFETQLAAVSNTMIENRDPQKTYNKVALQGLTQMSSKIDWASYFQLLALDPAMEVNVFQPKFLAGISSVLSTAEVQLLRDYFQSCILRLAAPYLTSDFEQANFEFYGKTLSGKLAMEPRWKRVQNTTSGALGEAIGQLYVKKFFPENAKHRMEVLIENLRTAFAQRIEALSWMSDTTKKEALAKLAAIRVKVGYPNEWRSYASLQIEPETYCSNVLRSNQLDARFDWDKIGKPVNKEEWLMFPQTVNAYYNPVANEIVFPAAILQPPFFYAEGDDAVNYGAIGVVIGHEMTHGFDDQGRQFDKNGNLTDWWTAEDATKFGELTKVLVERFNQFTVIDSLKANGSLTLGENIADLGGIQISYQAFQNSQKGQATANKLDGFTPEQRFILAYARIWAQNIRNEEVYRLTKEDEHSLGIWRVNGPLPLVGAFYEAFDIDSTSTMYVDKANRPLIW